MKVAILVNEDTAKKCTGHGCLKAYFNKADAFERYEGSPELMTFTHCGGDLEKKISRMMQYGVETVHLSSCMRSKNPEYEKIGKLLSQHFNVVGYTHGKKEGKETKTFYRSKIESNRTK